MDFADEPEFAERDEDLIATMLVEMKIEQSFEQFQQRGWTYISAEPIVFYADKQFPTDSGKIEIASAAAEVQGLPRLLQANRDPRAR